VSPPRRQAKTTTPPSRRPRVAGLRRPGGTQPTTEPAGDQPAEQGTVGQEPIVETGYAPPVWQEPEPDPDRIAEETGETEVIAESVLGGESETVAEQEKDDSDAVFPEPPPPVAKPTPTGKRRSSGISRPADLAEAEAEVADKAPSTTNWPLVSTIGLVVLALVFAGLAVWFRGEANRASDGADANNKALIDTARASEATGALRSVLEKTFSLNYTDLDGTANAVKESLTGKALCEYDLLFGAIKKLAPEQKIVITARVRELGITRLEGDRATALVFLDQTSTRVDQNQTAASAAQFGLKAERSGDKWRITEFDMLGQPLPNGQQTPQC
jgi:Mce-associated membrane protein